MGAGTEWKGRNVKRYQSDECRMKQQVYWLWKISQTWE